MFWKFITKLTLYNKLDKNSSLIEHKWRLIAVKKETKRYWSFILKIVQSFLEIYGKASLLQ